MSPEQIRAFLIAFNSGIKEKLVEPSREELSPEVVERLQAACHGTADPTAAFGNSLPPAGDFGVKFNF